MTTSRPGPSRSLSVPAIATAAVRLADGGGLDAVTMRSVAAAVGLTAPALYRYVASREELMAHMVDAVSATLHHPEPSGDWLGDLLAVAEQQVALHRAHPWLSAASAASTAMGPHVLDHLEWGVAVLAPLGASPTAVLEAIALTTGVAALFAAAEPAVGAEAFENLDARRHPALAALVAGPAPTPTADDVLRRVLAGVLTAVLDR